MTVQRLNQMSDNDQFLYDHVVQGKHIFDGSEYTSGQSNQTLKIWASNERFPMTGNKRAAINISWAGFFSNNCNPIVNVTVGRRDMNRLWVSVKGLGSNNWPDARGCQVQAVVDPDAPYNLTQHMPVHIIAIGY